ncbi:MAG: nucleotidyltransferase family protein [Armatimonadota bacterium]
MKTRSEVLDYLRSSMDRFHTEYDVRRIGIFGSVARDEAGLLSDIDVLVEITEPTFDKYMNLKFDLEEALGSSVDLVLADTVKKRLRSRIEGEVIYA